MAISLVAVGGKITAALVNLLIGGVNAQGLTAIIPTSVSGTGVSVGASGKVTFSAATVVNINGCFTAAYDNYRIVLNMTASGAQINVTLRVRLAGTDLTTGTYLTANQQMASVTPTYNYSATSTSITVGRANGTGGGGAVTDLISPALTDYTKVTSTGSDGLTGNIYWGTVLNTTAYDGFSLTPSTTTMTGSLRIYGYNNN